MLTQGTPSKSDLVVLLSSLREGVLECNGHCIFDGNGLDHGKWIFARFWVSSEAYHESLLRGLGS